MRRVQVESCQLTFIAILISIGLFLAACSTPATLETPQADGVTVFEGARLIVGDGSGPIEDAVFVVQNGQFTATIPAEKTVTR